MGLVFLDPSRCEYTADGTTDNDRAAFQPHSPEAKYKEEKLPFGGHDGRSNVYGV